MLSGLHLYHVSTHHKDTANCSNPLISHVLSAFKDVIGMVQVDKTDVATVRSKRVSAHPPASIFGSASISPLSMMYVIIASSSTHIERKRSYMASCKFVFSFLVAIVVMSIVNLTIFSLKTKRMLLPWQISPLHPPSLTFQELYDTQLKSKVSSQYDLAQVYVGKVKDALDLVQPSMVIAEVVAIFGHFIKFAVEQPESSVLAGQVSPRGNIKFCCLHINYSLNAHKNTLSRLVPSPMPLTS